MCLFCAIFSLLISSINLHGSVEDAASEALKRRVTPAERTSFYDQLDRTSRNLHGKIARTTLEPIFEVIASGDIPAIASIPEDSFNEFAANYMVARHIFKNSFNILLMFSADWAAAEPLKHDRTANLPVNKMDDMLMWAWSVRCRQAGSPRELMIKQMNFIQFATVNDGDKKS